MTVKLLASQRQRLLKLLYMQYTPMEISDETGISLIEIERACTDGCRYEEGESGTLIIGTDLQEWFGIKVQSSKKQPNKRGLINRENFKDVKGFLDYRIKVLQLDPISVRNRWIELRHLLEWAGPKRFVDGPSIEPFFPKYLATARNDGKDKGLGPAMQRRVCLGGRLFYEWAKHELSPRYDSLPGGWIKAIRPSKARIQAKISQHEAWGLEDVLKIARLSVTELHLKRAQAAICFLYLSGMRITAFLTLPLNCVDIENRKIEQNPDKGVITKNRKAAITTLLPITELINIAKGWDELVRSKLPSDSPWFAYLNHYDQLKSPEKDLYERVGGRRMACIEGMKRLCTLAGVPYKSPHKLRHGHAIFGIKHARDIRELKAISQNLMHSSLTITDGIYGNLNNEDMMSTIAALNSNANENPDLRALLQMMVALQNNPGLIKQILSKEPGD